MTSKLDSLPPEILFNVLSYAGAFDPRLLPQHPFIALSATCHQLRDTVEEYTRGLLKKHTNISPPKGPKRAAAFVCRSRWLKHISTTCPFCQSKTVSKATLDAKMPCCRKCDREYFPKMTQTDAQNMYHLSKLDLFTPNMLHPTLPPLSTGQYAVMGGEATMIAQPDVLARAAHIASLLGAAKSADAKHMRARQAKHRSLILKSGISVMQGGNNTMLWFRPSRVVAGQANQSLLVDQPDREKLKRHLSETHSRVMKSLMEQWADMGMEMEISTLPSWALRQVFGNRCEREDCSCALLEGVKEQGE